MKTRDSKTTAFHRNYNRDPSIEPLERIGFINHGSTLLLVLKDASVITNRRVPNRTSSASQLIFSTHVS